MKRPTQRQPKEGLTAKNNNKNRKKTTKIFFYHYLCK